MRRNALLASALWAAFSDAKPHYFVRQLNSSSSSSLPSTSSIYSTTRPSPASLPTEIDSATSTSSQSSSTASSSSSSSATSSTSIATTNSSTTEDALCTGCVIEAINPTTLSFESALTVWTDIIVTTTIRTKFTTYIDTIVSEEETLTQNQTVIVGGPHEPTVTATTPFFTWVPVPGTTVTLDVGPTYVAYIDLYGGLDFPDLIVDEPAETDPVETDIFPTDSEPPETCDATVRGLPVWPTKTEDYQYFIQTYVDAAPTMDPEQPVSLPPALLDHLKTRYEITSIYNGSDIETCTLRPTQDPTRTFITQTAPGSLSVEPPAETVPFLTQTTKTYIVPTYVSTSQHVSINSCLRCSVPGDGPKETQKISPPKEPPATKNNDSPQQRPQPPENSQGHQNPPSGPTDLPGLIASIINNPQFSAPPDVKNNQQNQYHEQHITVGDSVYTVKPAQPTPNNNEQNNHNQQQQNPGVVIGSETLTPGQTKTINGVPVVVPSEGGGSSIVVGGSTVAVQPYPTGPPVLTVGDSTITANPEGHFVVGTQTLTPGGSPITVDGSTLSLGPSGTIAVINGVTQTLGNAPFATGPPVLTVDGKTFSATVIGGSTQFVVGSQTLTPGGVLTVDGTTLSMPVDGSGSTVVVNGVTSTLDAPGLPVITLASQSVTASVVDGTTAFILGPSQTLTPGGVLTVSGTTLSMPASASGSVVVINGVTSTLNQPQITAAAALTIDGKTYSPTVRDGTTEYGLGPGTTLKPGEAVTISGTTYSLDEKGTALVINGKTSSIPKTPASNSASTTKSASGSETTASSTSTSTTPRDPGNFIASGIGITDKPGSGSRAGGGLDKWVEGMAIGFAGWLLLLL